MYITRLRSPRVTSFSIASSASSSASYGMCNELGLSPSLVVFRSHRGMGHLRHDSRLLVLLLSLSIDPLYLGLRLPPSRLVSFLDLVLVSVTEYPVRCMPAASEFYHYPTHTCTL